VSRLERREHLHLFQGQRPSHLARAMSSHSPRFLVFRVLLEPMAHLGMEAMEVQVEAMDRMVEQAVPVVPVALFLLHPLQAILALPACSVVAEAVQAVEEVAIPMSASQEAMERQEPMALCSSPLPSSP